jgi:hypothetical protein
MCQKGACAFLRGAEKNFKKKKIVIDTYLSMKER